MNIDLFKNLIINYLKYKNKNNFIKNSYKYKN